MMNLVMRFVRDEAAATAIEYGLIAAGISVSIIAVIQGIGSRLNTTFTGVEAALRWHAGPGFAFAQRLRPFAGALSFRAQAICLRPLHLASTGCSDTREFRNE